MRYLKEYCFFIFITLFFFLAAFKPAGIDRDYFVYYEDFYSHVDWLRFEPGYNFTKLIVRSFDGGFSSLIFVCASFGVFLKLYLIKKISPLPAASLLVYVSLFYVLHDLTQIRLSMSLFFVLLCFYHLCIARNILTSLFCLSLGVLFHYTAVIYLVLYVLTRRVNFFWLVFPFLGFVAQDLVGYIVSESAAYMPSFIYLRLSFYLDGSAMAINGLNYFWLLLSIIYVYSYYIAMNHSHDLCFVVSLKMVALAIFSFGFLSFNEVLAFRIFELFYLFYIFLAAFLIKYSRRGLIIFVALMIHALYYFVRNFSLLKLGG